MFQNSHKQDKVNASPPRCDPGKHMVFPLGHGAGVAAGLPITNHAGFAAWRVGFHPDRAQDLSKETMPESIALVFLFRQSGQGGYQTTSTVEGRPDRPRALSTLA